MIVAVPKNTLTPQQKSAMTKRGMIVIECDDPDKIRVISPETSFEANDHVMSALYALTTTNPTYRTEMFVNELYRRLKENEKPQP